MRIAMTLLVQDEADIVDAWLRYHLARDVDLVIVTDHRSTDGTSEILREYEQDERVVVMREDAQVLRQSEWVTRMSRLAAVEHAADWVIPSDADEFWWPRTGSYEEILAAVPPRFGVVRGLMRHFVLMQGDEPPLGRLTVRARPTADLRRPHHAQLKVAHRGTPDAVVGVGNHDVEGTGLRVLREWFAFEVLHFPVRDERQIGSKYLRRETSPDGQHIVHALELLESGRVNELVDELVVDDDALSVGLRDGSLVRDVRLRDALRALAETGSLPLEVPTVADDADLAEDADVVLGHDAAVKTERDCGQLERAVALLEQQSSLAGRVAGRFRLRA
jgi:hypothetical protein